MKITILASGSDGNCAILEDNCKQQLILDCGVKYDKIAPYINWGDCSCFISHKHKDHYNEQTIEKLKMFGLDVLSESNLTIGKPIQKNGYNILPIRLPHCDECDSIALLIYNLPEKKSMFFATDCTKLPNIVDKPFDLFMIENNYDEETAFANSLRSARHNIGHTHHLSTEYVVKWISKRQTKVKNLILSHLSNSGNIDIGSLTAKYAKCAELVYVAKPNLTVQF